ncbi:MAG: [FeFe] hydrogenase H-cluster radical SAM maturase HydG [Planctomycetes bacterium]|nr:[FeFe] hydrogenase H-cluster radical SAM maturase HydG [Planctomycetota bacterium]
MRRVSDSEKRLSRDACDFIDDQQLHDLLGIPADARQVRDVIAKSMAKEPLTVAETAVLVNTVDAELVESIFQAARQLKRDVYGNRIVLFAPLYIGNHCVNDCLYCGFRRSNSQSQRRTLDADEVRKQVAALQREGHKRLILVFGEHPLYSPEFIAETVRTVYGVKEGRGDIRRVNINAAPLDHDGFAVVKEAGIGTYQIFQETYHHGTYADVHPYGTTKGDYLWRLDALDRAWESGCDDVGIGALFGLYDWRFEVLGLVTHARHLMDKYHCGPHTISFPRLRPASQFELNSPWLVGDYDFKRLVAILRLSVPYTGMILTAREPAALREQLMDFGVSQIDAGSRIRLGGYTEAGDAQQQVTERQQFELSDVRSLDEVIRQLLVDGYIPSFCTACYRLGRTGEEFMEFAIPGFIEHFCTPNGLATLKEYLVDYASPETRLVGERLIRNQLDQMPDNAQKRALVSHLQRIETSDDRDLYF